MSSAPETTAPPSSEAISAPLGWLQRTRSALGLYNPAPPDPQRRAPLRKRLLRALNPANFPGPIFQKEVWISGRKTGTYWARALYAAGMLGFVTLVFTTANFDRFATTAAQRLQVSQEFAPAIFSTVISFQFLALALAGCILGAPAICEEKRSGTLGTLLTTPLKAWQIVVGKTAAFFVQILILTLIATPLMLAVRVFGGLTGEVVVACTCLSLSTALLAGLVGLLSSIGAKRTPNAVLGAIMFLVFSQGAVPLAYMIRDWCGQTVSWWNITYACAPAAAFVQLIGQYGAPIPQRAMHDAWVASTGYNLLLAAITLVLASLRLRRAMAREAAGGSPIPVGKKSKRPRRALDQAPDTAPSPTDHWTSLPVPKKKRRQILEHASRDVSDWPVLWRELRQSAFRSRAQLVYTSLVFLAILGFLYWKVGLDENGLHATLAIIAVLGALCVAAVSTTSGISGERESRTWEALLTTPLSARAIVVGKFAGAVRRQWFIPALLAVHFFAATVYYTVKHAGFDPSAILFVFAILIAPIVALSGSGVLLSVLCRKSTLAAVCNFGLALGFWLAVPIIGMIFGDLVDILPGERHDFFGVVLALNPVMMTGTVLESGLRGRYTLSPWGDVGQLTFTLVVAGYCVFYMLAGALCVRIGAGVLAARSSRRA